MSGAHKFTKIISNMSSIWVPVMTVDGHKQKGPSNSAVILFLVFLFLSSKSDPERQKSDSEENMPNRTIPFLPTKSLGYREHFSEDITWDWSTNPIKYLHYPQRRHDSKPQKYTKNARTREKLGCKLGVYVWERERNGEVTCNFNWHTKSNF